MPDGIASRFDSVEYAGADERLLDAVGFHPSTALLPRAGRRAGGGLTVTHGGTPEKATVAAGGGIIVDSAGGGGYRFVIPTPVDLTMPARPGSGTSRIDYVVAQIKNEDARPGDLLREVELELVSGVAGASPTAPTLTSGQLRLARLTVPASGAVVVSEAAQRTASVGGVIVVTDITERDAIEIVYNGLLVYVESEARHYRRSSGVWKPLSNLPAAHVRREATQSIPDGTPTMVSFDTEVYDNANMFPGSGSSITIPVAGRYRVTALLALDADTADGDGHTLQMSARVNGTDIIALARNSAWSVTAPTMFNASRTFDFDAGDTVGLRVSQSVGHSLPINGGTTYPTELIVEMLP